MGTEPHGLANLDWRRRTARFIGGAQGRRNASRIRDGSRKFELTRAKCARRGVAEGIEDASTGYLEHLRFGDAVIFSARATGL